MVLDFEKMFGLVNITLGLHLILMLNLVPEVTASDECQADKCSELERFSNITNAYDVLNYEPYRHHVMRSAGTLCFDLHCCADPGSTIMWYKNGRNLSDQNPRFELQSRNQTLRIESVKIKDEGNYSCKITKNGQSVIYWLLFQVTPRINSCDGEVEILKESTDLFVQAKLGSDITLSCVGHFCDEKNPMIAQGHRTVKWFTNKTQKYSPFGSDGEHAYSEKYETKIFYRKFRSIQNRTLLITNIQEEDYRTYYCKAVDGLDSWNTVIINVTLIPPDAELPSYDRVHRILIACLVSVSLLMALLALVGWYFKLEIKLFYKNRFGPITMKGDMLYHALVVYPETDLDVSNFVTEQLTSTLDELGYNLCVPELHFTPGHAIGDEYAKKLKVSCCAIVVISPAFLDSPWCNWIMQVALKQGRKVIFIDYEHVEVRAVTEDIKQLQSALLVLDRIKWPPKLTDKNKDRFYKTLRLRLPRL